MKAKCNLNVHPQGKCRKMLEMAFLGLYISKVSAGTCPQIPPSCLQLCRLVPYLLISYARQLEILVTALYVEF